MKNTSNQFNIFHVDKINYTPFAVYKQEDNSILPLALYKEGVELDVTGQTIELAAKRADNVVVQQIDNFTIDKNKVTITLKNNIISTPGLVMCELNIKDKAGAFTTSNFLVRVNEKLLNKESIEAGDILPALEKVKDDFVASSNNLKDKFKASSDKQLSDQQEEYDSLKKIIIDENASANLQNQIKETNSQLAHIENRKITKGDVKVSDINKNTGKFDETYMTEKFLEQIAGNTPISSVFADKSVTNKKLADKAVSYKNTDFFDVDYSLNLFNVKAVTDKGYIFADRSDSLIPHSSGETGISEYISVISGDVITSNLNWTANIYDSNFNYLSQKGFGIDSFTIPEDGAYIRYSVNLKKTDLMIVKNISLPNKYISYGEIVSPNIKLEEIINSVIKTAENTDFFEVERYNLFNKLMAIEGKQIGSVGELIDKIDSCASDYIEITPNTKYYTSNNWNGAYYTKDKLFIGSKPFGVTSHISPSDAYYLRMSIPIALKDTYMISKEEISDYYQYAEYLKIKGYRIEILANQLEKFITKPHALKRKKWVCVGDSLTEKNIRATKNYHDYIAEQTGVTVINMGVGGTGYKRQEENNNAFYQRVKNIPVDADIITIFGSGNDLGGTVGIGKLGNPTDTTTDTICGCINKAIDEIYKIKTDAKIGIITPCPWGNNNPINPEVPMAKYSNAIIEVCKLRGIPCLDLYRSSNMRPWDENFRLMFYKRDEGNSVHPDEDGHKFMFNRFLKFIESL